jgi:hypothetical protein
MLEFARHIAGQSEIAAIAEVDDYSKRPANQRMIKES